MNIFRYARDEWADALAALSNIVFTVALWPSVVVNNPPEPATSLMTIIALLMLTAGMLKKRLFAGVFFQCFCIALWVVLYIQGVS